MSWLVALKMEGRLEGAILTDLSVCLPGEVGGLREEGCVVMFFRRVAKVRDGNL